MKLYFAAFSTVPELFAKLQERNPEILESYLFFKSKNIAAYLHSKGITKGKLFLDSGAFSAFTRNVQINIDDYCDFIKSHSASIEMYAALDVIGNAEATRKNVEYMEAKGLHPLPTFHYKSPISELHRMCEKYDYIALGGLVPIARQRKRMQAWLDTCFSVIKQYWPIKVHGFGVNAYWAWERYPFYSVDATSWQASGRFAEEYILKDGKPKRESSKMTAFKVNNKPYKARFENTCVMLIRAKENVTALWKARGVTWDIDPTVQKIFDKGIETFNKATV